MSNRRIESIKMIKHNSPYQLLKASQITDTDDIEDNNWIEVVLSKLHKKLNLFSEVSQK